jgi:large subunit ribosomal protein L6
MSRIGNLPITLTDKVKVDVSSGNLVTMKGPKGELSTQVDPEIGVEVKDGEMVVTRPTEQKRHKSLHGLYRSLLHNMTVGVTEGYKRELEVIGVGYRAAVTNGVLELALGYSHPIFFMPPGHRDLG